MFMMAIELNWFSWVPWIHFEDDADEFSNGYWIKSSEPVETQDCVTCVICFNPDCLVLDIDISCRLFLDASYFVPWPLKAY